MSYRSRGKKKGFGFGGFSLTSSFHKSGELGSWQKERKGWSATKHRSEDEYVEIVEKFQATPPPCDQLVLWYQAFGDVQSLQALLNFVLGGASYVHTRTLIHHHISYSNI
jgi:hypothetical protein